LFNLLYSFSFLTISFLPLSLLPLSFVPPLVTPSGNLEISSEYGKRFHPIKKTNRIHHGIDLKAKKGDKVKSIGYGTVFFADSYAGYGKFVSISHSNGYSSHYAHLSSINVKVGDKVKASDLIGRVGSTGLSTAPHLHFEIRKDGNSLNPKELLKMIR